MTEYTRPGDDIIKIGDAPPPAGCDTDGPLLDRLVAGEGVTLTFIDEEADITPEEADITPEQWDALVAREPKR